VDGAVRALRDAHPYEEPAFDLVRLARAPTGLGFGRKGDVGPAKAHDLVERTKQSLGLDRVLVAGPLDREVTRAAVCAGSGGEFVGDAIATGMHLLLTGELRHHAALRAAEAGLTVICTRHSSSERAALAPLAARLTTALPGVEVRTSAVDRDPFAFA
jgi:putative NIF3 family GTP cyclohydrolase 1 type 2